MHFRPLPVAAETLLQKLNKKRAALWEKMNTKINVEADGYTGAEVHKMCSFIELMLHDEMQQLTLPKCQVVQRPFAHPGWDAKCPEIELVSFIRHYAHAPIYHFCACALLALHYICLQTCVCHADHAAKPESLYANGGRGGREGAQPDQAADSVRAAPDGRGGRGPSDLGPSGQVDAAAGARHSWIQVLTQGCRPNCGLDAKPKVRQILIFALQN